MAGMYTNLLYHLVFSTKNREPAIVPTRGNKLHKNIGGIIRAIEGSGLEINGMPDRVHILANLPPNAGAAARLSFPMAGLPRCRRSRRNGPRSGAVYVAVLGVALIVGVIGLASLHVSRIETRAGVTTNDLAHAHLMAQSAVEFALGQVESAGSSWRTSFTSGVEVPDDDWIQLGQGQLKFVLVDEDGDLNDNPADSIVLRGIGRAGGATSVSQITLAPAGTGLNCLEAALHSVGMLTIDGATVSGSGLVSAATGVTANSANIQLPVETSGTPSGVLYQVPPISGAPLRDVPDPTSVFEYYLANGTWIDVGDIGGGTGVMDRSVLAPGYNPFGSGATNPQGIYIIDCQGADLVIQNSRLHATLVILNGGSGTRIAGSIHWEPAAANFPAMLVQGNMQFDWNPPALVEDVLDVNFNPPGAPSEGEVDSDMLDEYPSVVQGIAYIGGGLNVTGQCQFEGVVLVGGACNVSSNIELTHRELFFNAPPPGFATGGTVRLVPGTWKRAAY